jgi:hypothetical protein
METRVHSVLEMYFIDLEDANALNGKVEPFQCRERDLIGFKVGAYTSCVQGSLLMRSYGRAFSKIAAGLGRDARAAQQRGMARYHQLS